MKLVLLVEELSMAEMLNRLLPRLVAGMNFLCVPHEGKSDLEASIPRKLRAWQEPGVRFLVVRDQDNGDCRAVKARLVELCAAGGRPETMVRIVCRELEAWYLADLAAVEQGLGVTGLARRQEERKFRRPESLGHPSRELKEIAPGFQKVSGAKAIAPHLDLRNARADSFRVFVEGVRRLAGDAGGEVVGMPEEAAEVRDEEEI